MTITEPGLNILPIQTVSTTTASEAAHPARLARELAARGMRYAAISFVDVHGKPKNKMVPLEHLERAASGSELFTGAALDGVPQEVQEEEVAAVPDLRTPYVLPTQPEMAIFPSTLHHRGVPFEACSRGILQRSMTAARKLGYTFNLGIETEFFILRRTEDGNLVPAASSDTLDKPCYDLRSLLRNFGIVDEIAEAMRDLEWGLYSFDHEDANGQFETDFGYADAVTTADRLVFFRLMVAELAHRRGLIATFMPKPKPDYTGSAGHMNMSLADASGHNAFTATDDPRGLGLSELGYQFIAGVLRHAPAICAVVAPTVNSYKRLLRRSSNSGFTWAPILACYGGNNRTNMLRVPLGGGRVECRAADSSANPYLAAALMLAAGLEGIREELDPGAPNRDNMYLLEDAELDARGIHRLPSSLGEALAAFDADPLTRDVFGEAMHASFLDVKRSEWDAYCAHVSDWEIERYLEFF